MRLAIYVLLAVVFLILFSGGYVFYVACVRGKELIWSDEEAIKKTPHGMFYENISIGEQFLKENNAKQVVTKSFDGLNLWAEWIPAENPKGTILLAHGYRSNKLLDFSLVLEMYHNLGMNILLPNQRSHGKSEG